MSLPGPASTTRIGVSVRHRIRSRAAFVPDPGWHLTSGPAILTLPVSGQESRVHREPVIDGRRVLVRSLFSWLQLLEGAAVSRTAEKEKEKER